MRTIQYMLERGISLNKALDACGVSKQKWYWKKQARESKADPSVPGMIRDIREKRFRYGTRRVAAELPRQLDKPVNRKAIRRLYVLEGWNRPAPPKVDAKVRWKPIKAVRPNQLWQTDITYVWCGQVEWWCYRFNVLDVFTGWWIAYHSSTLATVNVAVESPVGVVATAKPDCSRLTIQCDNTSQYAGKKFRKAASNFGIKI